MSSSTSCGCLLTFYFLYLVIFVTFSARTVSPASWSKVTVTQYQRVQPRVHANFYRDYGHSEWLKRTKIYPNTVPISHFHYEVEHPLATKSVSSSTPSSIISERSTPSSIISERSTPSSLLLERSTPSSLLPQRSTPSSWTYTTSKPLHFISSKFGQEVPEVEDRFQRPFANKRPSNLVKRPESWYPEKLDQSNISFPEDGIKPLGSESEYIVNSPPRVQNQLRPTFRPPVEDHSPILFPGDSYKRPVTVKPALVERTSTTSTTVAPEPDSDKKLAEEFLDWLKGNEAALEGSPSSNDMQFAILANHPRLKNFIKYHQSRHS